MPRTARVSLDNSFYHVYNKGTASSPLFQELTDYHKFLTRLAELKTKNFYDHTIYAYILMPNHFHLLIETAKDPLASIVSSLLTSYSMYYNKKYQKRGSLFKERFKSKLCDKGTYFLGASRYIYLNPVAEGLAPEPIDYLWSGLSEFFGKTSYKIVDQIKVEKIIDNNFGGIEKYYNFIKNGKSILHELSGQYKFSRQIEPKVEAKKEVKRELLKDKIRRSIDRWFGIR